MDCQYEDTIKNVLKQIQALENKIKVLEDNIKILEEDNLTLTIQNGKLEERLMNIDSYIYNNNIKERGVKINGKGI